MVDEIVTVERCRHCGCEWVCPDCGGVANVQPPAEAPAGTMTDAEIDVVSAPPTLAGEVWRPATVAAKCVTVRAGVVQAWVWVRDDGGDRWVWAAWKRANEILAAYAAHLLARVERAEAALQHVRREDDGTRDDVPDLAGLARREAHR